MNIDTVMDVPALCAVIKEKYDLFSTRKVLYDRWYQCFLENFYYSKEKGSGRYEKIFLGVSGICDAGQRDGPCHRRRTRQRVLRHCQQSGRGSLHAADRDVDRRCQLCGALGRDRQRPDRLRKFHPVGGVICSDRLLYLLNGQGDQPAQAEEGAAGREDRGEAEPRGGTARRDPGSFKGAK